MSAGHAVVDLGAVESIDLFITDFGEEGRDFGQYYKIEVSTDSVTWQVVVDKSTVADSSLRLAVDKIEPVDARYVKLVPLGPVTAVGESVGANEFKVLRTAPAHAPAIYIDDIELSSRFTRFQYYVIPTNDAGYMKTVRSNGMDDPFMDIKGYRRAEIEATRGTVRPDNVIRYFTKTYSDGVEVLSADTLSVDWSISAVNSAPIISPSDFVLYANYPNPFNPTTMISYSLPRHAHVEVTIYNTFGRKVKTVLTSFQEAGFYSISWNGQDEAGRNVASGLYYCRLNVDGTLIQARKMLLLR